MHQMVYIQVLELARQKGVDRNVLAAKRVTLTERYLQRIVCLLASKCTWTLIIISFFPLNAA